MAKRAVFEGKKSDVVRAAIAKNPNVSPKEILAIIKSEGIDVSLALVNKIKYSDRKGKVRRRRRRHLTDRANGHANGHSPNVAVDALLSAKAFADRVGGVEVAKRAIDTLSRVLA